MEQWVILHPRMVRAFSAGLVVIGAVCFIRLVQHDAELAARLKLIADNAREASEALGG